MGMFDYVRYECICPVCHSKVIGFQSKSGECELKTVEPKSVANFYSACSNCGSWLEYTAKITTNFKRKVFDKDHQVLSEHERDVLIK